MEDEQHGHGLAAFSAAADRLKQAADALGVGLATSWRVGHRTRHQLGALAFDIDACRALLHDLYVEARRLSIEDTRRMNDVFATQQVGQVDLDALVAAIGDPLHSPHREAFRRLQVAIKTLYMFVRAYHDVLFKVLMELDGQRARNPPSMASAFKDERPKTNHPVGKMLTSAYPEYAAWFFAWRKQRNTIKEGVGLGAAGPEHDLGITFVHVDPGTGGIVVDLSGRETVRMSDLAAALDASARLTTLALDVLYAAGSVAGPEQSTGYV